MNVPPTKEAEASHDVFSEARELREEVREFINSCDQAAVQARCQGAGPHSISAERAAEGRNLEQHLATCLDLGEFEPDEEDIAFLKRVCEEVRERFNRISIHPNSAGKHDDE
ncbi:MAG: hypothetical protein OEY44_03555 [Candidatus Peregrinibacteria bacterium]|nr:hypothetical protein [Candidatus Peregrinibacteria bacterium]